jgi:flagellin
MAQVINTNIMSLNAQRNLSMSQSSLATAMQRLSSGLRVNSAKDDAAGLAISERFTTQIRGLNQAVRNANDGISLSQTAEGALASYTSNLQRIRELAVQSANATNSSSDRSALDLEVQQRLAEMDRIATQTSFNGQKILDGSFGTAAFQVGANVGQTIAIDLATSMRTNAMGAIATDVGTVNVTDLMDGVKASASSSVTATDFRSFTSAGSVGALSNLVDDGTGTTGSTYTVTLASGTTTLSFSQAIGDGATVTAATAAANIASQMNTAGFTNDGDTVSGFTVDFGGAANLTTALTTGTLSFKRFDQAAFTLGAAQSAGDGAISAGGFANLAGPTLNSSVDNTQNKTLQITPAGGAAFSVNLNSNITSANDLAAAIQASSGYSTSGFTASSVSGKLVITDTANPGAAADVTLSGTAMTAPTTTPLLTSTTYTQGKPATPVTVSGDFAITIGNDPATATTYNVKDGTYSTTDSLLDAVNAAIGGAGYASLDSTGKLQITANENIAVSGATGTTTLGLLASATAGGDLTTVNVKTVDAANSTIQRIDAALTTVNTMRSTFGAIQNRFESTISNLQTTSENLNASRSRIMDADFAQETAALSRAQILQQAGTAMVAQANQLPQGVLALLR